MSRKRNVKLKLIVPKTDDKIIPSTAATVNQQKQDVKVTTPTLTEGDQTAKEAFAAVLLNTPSVPTKEEQLAKMLFTDLLKDTLKITERFENDKIIITPITWGSVAGVEGEDASDDLGKELACYSIVSKSNPNVVVYVDNASVCVSLNNKGVSLKEAETIHLASNILAYIRKHFDLKVA